MNLINAVYICSPLRGDIERNISRANGYCRFAATQGIVPLAPHAMFTQFLDDARLAVPTRSGTGARLAVPTRSGTGTSRILSNQFRLGFDS